MSIKVDSSYSVFFSVTSSKDDEWQRIIDRLWRKYGVRSTGSKAADKAKLHELEMKEVEQLGGECSSGKFLTVTRGEIEKIKNKRREKKIETNPEEYPNTTKGAEVLGKQIFLAIQIKKTDDDIENQKKRNNKYQT